MNKFVTKKSVLITSSLYVFFLVAIFLFGNKCYHNNWCYINLSDKLLVVAVIFLPLLPTFIFSLITYFMRAEVYQSWWKLTRWWIPLSIFLVLLMPEDNGAFLPIDKDHVGFFMSGLYAILSIAIIFMASVTSPGERK